jgi:riboflavin biosynthesis pyrimidine reductase
LTVFADHPPSGPTEQFEVLFDESSTDGVALPAEFASVYGSAFNLPPAHHDRPYTMVNFVCSRDGRISFGDPTELGGSAINNGCTADVWLMGLLRARCDAVVMGDGTLRAESEHVWTPAYLGGCDWQQFEALRAHEGRRPIALHVFVSLNGQIPVDAEILRRDDIEIVVATTTAAHDIAVKSTSRHPRTTVRAFGDDRVDTAALSRWLFAEHGVRSMLCEGGPGLYGSMLADGVIDDEFLTLSPTMVGGPAPGGERRPSLIEGASFRPRNGPRSIPISLRRAGDHLMLRSRIEYPHDSLDGAR